ncbi:MAG: CoA activase [Proteobacteria bacterium]|nr:CoA activase [Pseudomonadota bacterium]
MQIADKNSFKNNGAFKVGIDVGSTTVKAVVMDEDSNILWKKYQRHNTKQAQLVGDFLTQIEAQFKNHKIRVFTTGSGGRAISPYLNAHYIQEVNAITYAVEKLCTDVRSVVELGGQDAKVIIWKEDNQGRKSTLTFMNDKCAGGTGATIDKILTKTGISVEEALELSVNGKTIHHIAAKCGVFAETDVVGLLKSGIDPGEIVVSLFTSMVQQNMEVLVRGNVLRDNVLLLGGPHTYFKSFAEIWRKNIPETWKLHRWAPSDRPLEELIYVPDDSEYFAAIGAVLFGQESESLLQSRAKKLSADHFYNGLSGLDDYIGGGRISQLMSSGAVQEGLVTSAKEVEEFAEQYAMPEFVQPQFPPHTEIDCWVGIDGGSTSSKLVLIGENDDLIFKDYILSGGNPIDDVREMFANIETWSREKKLTINIKGTGVTGYASDILKQAFNVDLAVVETVAHMRSAVHYYGQPDVICDVGGQDIKVLFLKHGRVVDFKLNTQCSAGNGYFLQGMAEQFNVPITDYAKLAFEAQKAPSFNYGCAVFMEQDRVNFQQLGWTKEEIMAGLALVLPKNIWNYVVQEPNLSRFGKRMILQGGTQKNLAAVKAQVDFIKSKVPDAEVHVHRYADISGAIGVAIEVKEQVEDGKGRFIGIESAAHITFTTRNDQRTRCTFCPNKCARTFVHIKVSPEKTITHISGWGCEKGMARNVEDMKSREREKKAVREKHPDLVEFSSKLVFDEDGFTPPLIPKDLDGHPSGNGGLKRSSAESAAKRSRMVVGIPKLLNLFLYAPFFKTYLRTLGVGKVVYSDDTSAKLWEEGNKWGSIDPCFPAKVAPAHIYNLIEKKKPTHILFPRITHLESVVKHTLGNTACVIQMGTPEVTHAAFTKDMDHFTDNRIAYWKPLLNMDRQTETEGEMFIYFKDRLEITEDENAWAVKQGFQAMADYFDTLRQKGTEVINELITRDKIGILVVGHPYHHDPGINHGILEEFQARGFPILCIESLPVTAEFLGPLFGDSSQEIEHDDIRDVWKRNFNRNTNIKIWAAKVAARHPNLAVVDFSSFKCGHDAPTYSYIEEILDASETPHFLFHDVDQSKPKASFNIRIQTIEYFLLLEQERMRKKIRELNN